MTDTKGGVLGGILGGIWGEEKQEQGNPITASTIGPQTDHGEVGRNAGAITGTELKFNDSQPYIIQSRGGRAAHNFTIPANQNNQQYQVNFQPNAGTGGWNSNFLTFFGALPRIYNYYELLSVEYIFFTGLCTLENAMGTVPGFSTFVVVPWTAQYNVGNVAPGTNLTLLKGCEFLPCIVKALNTQYRVEDLQQQYRFRIRPQFQQNSAGSNRKGQYMGGPIQIQDQGGTDNTLWYGWLAQFFAGNLDATNERLISVPFYYRYTVKFSGRRFSTIDLTTRLFSKLMFRDLELEDKILNEASELTSVTLSDESLYTHKDEKLKELMNMHVTNGEERFKQLRTDMIEQREKIEQRYLEEQMQKKDDVTKQSCKFIVNEDTGNVAGFCKTTGHIHPKKRKRVVDEPPRFDYMTLDNMYVD